MAYEPVDSQVVLTPEGKRKLEEELLELKVVKRVEVAEDIKTALSFGDLSENAEYDEAKNAQARIEGRVRVIEEMLRRAVIIDASELPTDIVAIGNSVKVLDLEYEEEDTYTVVGAAEADPQKLYISNESPIGVALLGARVGDTVEAHTPGGDVRLKVLSIGTHREE